MYVVGGGSKKTYARFFKKPKLAIFFFSFCRKIITVFSQISKCTFWKGSLKKECVVYSCENYENG